MVSNLTNKHFSLIKNFSRKVSKGINADDLSQHVILKLLKKDIQFINGLIFRDEFDRWIWRFIQGTFNKSNSNFNIEMYDCYNKGTIYKKPINIELGTIDVINEPAYVNPMTELKSIINNSDLTDMDRKYLDLYISKGCNYVTCSRETGIHSQTISHHVRKAIDKCRS